VRIKRVVVSNFRGIKRLDFAPGDRNLIIGRNGSGKTSLLVALDYALNPNRRWAKGEFPDWDFHDENSEAKGRLWDDTECKGVNIEVWLGDFRDNEDIQHDWDLVLEHVGRDEVILSGESENLGLANPIVRVTFACGQDRTPQWYFTKPEANHRRLSTEDRARVGFQYIPSWRNPLEELSLRYRSVLSRLLEGKDLSGQIAKIRSKIDSSGELLHEDESFKKGFDGLRRAMREARLLTEHDDALGLSALEATERSILRAFGLQLRPEGSNQPIPLRYLGSGTQNAALLLALVVLLKSGQSTIVALEEPEQNLEPFYQRYVMRQFKDATGAGGQLFVTSYSYILTSVLPEDDCWLVTREADGNHICEQPYRHFRGHLLRQTKSRLADELFPVLLSRGVLLLEGESEFGALPVFSRLATRGLDTAGVEPFYCRGRDGMPDFCDFFKKRGYRTIALMDHDTDADAHKRRKECVKRSDLVLLWPRRYEEALVATKGFDAGFGPASNELLAWDDNQHIYKAGVMEKKKNDKAVSPTLAAFRAAHTSEIEAVRTLTDLLDLLDRNSLKPEYLFQLLHQRFTAPHLARRLAELLTDDDKAKVPPAAMNLLLAVAAFMDGTLVSRNGETEAIVDIACQDSDGKFNVQRLVIGKWLAPDLIHLAEAPQRREATDTRSDSGEATAH